MSKYYLGLKKLLLQINMRAALGVVLALLAVAAALPQREGGVYTNEAIRQAQNSQLIPKDAQIQKVNYI